jgi:hypothetical protein
MDQKILQQGITTVTLKRFESEVLPRLLELKNKVDQGELINERDIDFLKNFLKRLAQDKYGVDQHPEWQSFYAQLVDLSNEIIAKGVENEGRSETARKTESDGQ